MYRRQMCSRYLISPFYEPDTITSTIIANLVNNFSKLSPKLAGWLRRSLFVNYHSREDQPATVDAFLNSSSAHFDMMSIVNSGCVEVGKGSYVEIDGGHLWRTSDAHNSPRCEAWRLSVTYLLPQPEHPILRLIFNNSITKHIN